MMAAEEMLMEMLLTHHEEYSLARICGPLDEDAREPFREQLHPLFAARGRRLIVDLSDVPRINSPGIGNLVALVADANTNGCQVTFCALSPFVASVMAVTKLNRFFDIAENLDTAVTRAGAA
jgi:anti-anti-sigma factor